ncbi:hypothetical protein [Thiomicrorhabdus sp.]|uniref:hypothetical protein n=1 Tax=Thiomicrorhabdus sp. TaxID=2039724 RepID=UPI002AA6CADF|nr:hypothetical protein [Thiomicrorhabdus sp.]
MERVSVLKLSLFKDSEKSFLAALDAEGIEHSRVDLFTNQPHASEIVESISALSKSMPWNAIAKVIVKWIDARKSRKIIITTEDGKVIHAEGYSIKELESILPKTERVSVIDIESHNES